jgi:hypothetical protein
MFRFYNLFKKDVIGYEFGMRMTQLWGGKTFENQTENLKKKLIIQIYNVL